MTYEYIRTYVAVVVVSIEAAGINIPRLADEIKINFSLIIIKSHIYMKNDRALSWHNLWLM